jgi:peptide/nickel transport system ATP-binding protein
MHPYTKALLEVVPEAGGIDRPFLQGEPPDPTLMPPGCRFHPRCPALAEGRAASAGVESRCREEDLGLEQLSEGRFVACHLAARLARGGVPSPPPASEGETEPTKA